MLDRLSSNLLKTSSESLNLTDDSSLQVIVFYLFYYKNKYNKSDIYI